jgi:3',5'-cyclic AMP phosphodiesterase CpdA
MATPLTVLHVSDFQCGSPFLPKAADAMLRVAEEVRPDVVVASGDLTQRAKVREFALARSILDRFGSVPLILTPGNHDVPLYRFWERLATPFRNWRAFAGNELDTVHAVPGATFVALNSAAPRRAIINGWIGAGQVEFARAAFEAAPADDVRVLVIHHHFVPVPTGEGSRPLPGAARLATQFARMGVDVVMGGHVHQLHIRSSAGLPFVATGTTTSRRGRGREEGWNSLCVHRFGATTLEVTPWLRSPDATDFEPGDGQAFDLRSRAPGGAGSGALH